MMGSPETETGRFDNETQHKVIITKGFELQQSPVTQLEWYLMMGNNPSNFKEEKYCKDKFIVINGTTLCPDHPVEMVSWNDVQNYIQKLNEKSSQGKYRLPTEAEWEYAARAGTKTAFPFADSIDDTDKLNKNMWYGNNANNQTQSVATKEQNPFGFHDMNGNVWQWVEDNYGEYPKENASDPSGAPSGPYRVIRGGSWSFNPRGCRSANRYWYGPERRVFSIGFRTLRTP